MLNTPARPAFDIKPDFYNLQPGTCLLPGEVMFLQYAGAEALSRGGSGDSSSKIAAVATSAKAKRLASQEVEDGLDYTMPDLMKIDLRVGRITKVWHHETAEKLFCEEIDVGEAVARPVASGLRGHYTLEDMQDRLVVVVCNLKEAKMQGFESKGMVLASKSADGGRIELVDPPVGAVVGERIVIDGLSGSPFPAAKVKKHKLWETVAGDLIVDADSIVSWQSNRLVTQTGKQVCTVPSNVNCPVG